MTTDVTVSVSPEVSTRRTLDLAELLFLAGATVAPLDLLLIGSFSVYDITIVIVAFLIVTGPRRLQLLPSGLAIAGYVFVLAALVSTLRATHPLESVTQIAQFAFIFFVQLPVVLTMARSQFMLRATLACFSSGSAVGVVQAFLERNAQGADRLLAFFSDNPNRLGYLSSCVLPFALLLLGILYHRRRILLATGLAVLVAYALVWSLAASASRGATVAAVVAVVVYVGLRPGQGFIRLITRPLIAALLVVSAGCVLLQTDQFPQTLRERIERSTDAEEYADLFGDRTQLAIAGLRAFEQSPLIGTGLDNFRHVAVRYEPAASSQAPHNVWIQSLAQVGIVGTLAFLYMMAWWFAQVYRVTARRRVGDPDRDVTWALFAAMASVMTILMTIPVMNQRHYWLLYGLGVALVLRFAEETRQECAQSSVSMERRRRG
jgi:O-antigen ligase